jgi:predicted PurR-regulated permease PerM
MDHKKSELYFLLALLVGVAVLAVLIFKPFLYAFIFAIVFAAVFQPVHDYVFRAMRGAKGAAALCTSVIVLASVVVPFAVLGTQIFHEATALYDADFSRDASSVIKSLEQFFPASMVRSIDLTQYARGGLGWLLQHLGLIFGNIARALIGVFIFLVALYYLFKDGDQFKKQLIALSPLQDIHDELIVNKLTLAMNAVIRGKLAIALIQGALTAIGFVLLGVPNGALWGSVAAIAALVPGVGTALVFFPATLYLAWRGEIVSAIGLLLWGTIAVGLIDNVLGPKLIGQGMQLHPLIILLSIIGGIILFGPLGFLLGPLVVILLRTLIEIYCAVRQEHEG